ncbi:hypothetical protein LEP1GSC198_2746 [Leptospira kirschneri str. JB]|nr:hypothetical protein [Leptospira kirschneri]EMJ92874.1 hypothetical protein LEP1GSC198_2746 [Leptospira kirschneri str. JB]
MYYVLLRLAKRISIRVCVGQFLKPVKADIVYDEGHKREFYTKN